MRTFNWNYITKLYYNWYRMFYLLEDEVTLHCISYKVFTTFEASAKKANEYISNGKLFKTRQPSV
jgi:hypothetical protein